MYLNICIKIASFLKNENTRNQGLLHGKMGESIFFYILAKKLSNREYANRAEELIDDIFKMTTPIINFKDGIMGIGWGLEYLLQNDYCEGDRDEVLEDIDSKIFKFINEKKEIPFGLENGLVGCLQYIIMRLKNRTESQNDMAKINVELLKLIIHRIDEITPRQFVNSTRDISFNLLDDIYIMLFSCVEAYELNIYCNKIQNMFKQWETYLLSFIPNIHFNRLYLALVLVKINQILKSDAITHHVKTLLYSLNVNQLKTELDLRDFSNFKFNCISQLLILNRGIKSFEPLYPNYIELVQLKSEILNLYNEKLITEFDNMQSEQIDNKKMKFKTAHNWLGTALVLLTNPDMLNSQPLKIT